MNEALLAVPNLSARHADDLSGPLVVDVHEDRDHTRTVLTFAGPADDLLEACVETVRTAVATLDLRNHAGQHPRFGVVDVLPIVPYLCAEADAARVASELRSQVERLGVPVHTYDRADPAGRSLPELRRWLRTYEHPVHPTAGVVCLGVRDPLIAFNVDFRGELTDAKHVARAVRAPEIRALGFELASRNLVQVSMNLIAPERVGPKEAFDRVLALAKGTTLQLVDCEVVGLVPEPHLAELDSLPLRAPVRSIEQALTEKGLS